VYEQKHRAADSEIPPQTPTSQQVTQGVADLLKEVDSAFASDRGAIRDDASDREMCLLYGAAALRHCCRLLDEIEGAAASQLEFAVRNLGRAHIETWLVGLYIHFGGYEALTRVAQEARHGLEGIDLEGKQFDERLADTKKAARRSSPKVAATNGGITRWNQSHPDEPPKLLHDEPYVPQLSPVGIDLTRLIAEFGEHEAQALSVSEIVDSLTKWGPEKGFGRESFRSIYLNYRMLSTVGTHATMHVLERYLEGGGFVRVKPYPAVGSAIDSVRITSLYGTAYLASQVLGEHGFETPAADQIISWLPSEPAEHEAQASRAQG
jgi:hypothetical protein